MAYDQDTGINARLRYSIILGNENGFFEMNAQTGELFLIREIDLEKLQTPTLSLQIQVSQVDNPLRQALARVDISVQDINDNSPEVSLLFVFPLRDYFSLSLSLSLWPLIVSLFLRASVQAAKCPSEREREREKNYPKLISLVGEPAVFLLFAFALPLARSRTCCLPAAQISHRKASLARDGGRCKWSRRFGVCVKIFQTRCSLAYATVTRDDQSRSRATSSLAAFHLLAALSSLSLLCRR